MAIAAILVALAVATPELASPAGAALARSANGIEMQSKRATHSVLVAKRKKRKSKLRATALRKAKLARYIKAHPGVLGKKLKGAPLTLKEKLKAKALLKKHTKKKATAKQRAAAKKRKAGAKKTKGKGGAAAKKSKKGKQAGKAHPLGTIGYLEILLLALLPFGAIAALLVFTDFQRRPRAPSPQRRRRTLVITPMSRNR